MKGCQTSTLDPIEYPSDIYQPSMKFQTWFHHKSLAHDIRLCIFLGKLMAVVQPMPNMYAPAYVKLAQLKSELTLLLMTIY